MKKPGKTKSVDVTKEQFLAFEAVRLSGITDMGATTIVEELSGLSEDKVFEILNNHDYLKTKYSIHE